MTLDLRQYSATTEIQRVATAFSVSVDIDTTRRKRRTIGFPSDRNTWVRIEARPVDKIDGQGWNGIECSAVLHGVARPDWHQSISWRDQDYMWRADETELISVPPVKPAGILIVDPNFPDAWWATLASSLAAIARQTTPRLATPGMQPITGERVTATIHAVFPDLDTRIDEWAAAHGDFAWANVTAPECVILDWEDWGMAPRGFDAATLWLYSLAVPVLADRVYQAFQADLDSQSGLLCRLMHCAEVMTWPGYEMLGDPAKTHAQRIVDQLTRSA